MELKTAHQIIDTLAQGIHPVTGEAMPADSPYNAPPVIRALFTVSQALSERQVARPAGQIRLKGSDGSGNVYYLVVTPARIYLTNRANVPLCLSNICADAPQLQFRLGDIRDSELTQANKRDEALKAVRAATNGIRWEAM